MGNNQEFLIALGGNLPSAAGDTVQTLNAAVAQLMNADLRILALSRFYQTPCFPPGSGPDYVNAAARLDYAGDAASLLSDLHRIEAEFGRRRVQRWGRRTLDLDLIAAGSAVLPDLETHARWRDLPSDEQAHDSPDALILPHPRMQDRAFVLIPLADVAPEWVHPVLGKSVTEMLEALTDKDKSDVRAL